MTLGKAFCRGIVTQPLLHLWLVKHEIDRDNHLMEELKGRTATIVTSIVMIAMAMFAAEYARMWYLVPIVVAIAGMFSFSTFRGGHLRCFVRDCEKLHTLLNYAPAATAEEMQKQATEVMVECAGWVRGKECLLEQARNGSAPDGGVQMAEAALARENEWMRKRYDLFNEFGLVSGGYGPYFKEADRQLAEEKLPAVLDAASESGTAEV